MLSGAARRMKSYYHASAATPPANHSDFFNTHSSLHKKEDSKGLPTIGGSIPSNQAESPTPSFVGKITQLSASSFHIPSLDLHLA